MSMTRIEVGPEGFSIGTRPERGKSGRRMDLGIVVREEEREREGSAISVY